MTISNTPELHDRYPILRFFSYLHLPSPSPMQEVSRMFHDLVWELVERGDTTDSEELEFALRKLLEAKDAAVRSVLWR